VPSFKKTFPVIGLTLVLMCLGVPFNVLAEPENLETETEIIHSWVENLDMEWGGHVRGRGMMSWAGGDSFYRIVETDTLHDGSAEFRLKNKLLLGEWGYLDTHYETIWSFGDTRRSLNKLADLFPLLFENGVIIGEAVNDDRRLLDLTSTISEEENYILYHRLDRLALTLLPEWGSVRVGRQAITWGNGLLFNPMDLFNPFSPTDIEREYKIGDDMVNVQVATGRLGDVQLLYVPRRDPVDHDVEWNESSVAGKVHLAAGVTEFDILAARHYEDYVIGLGSMGYLGSAAWRADATWTFLDGEGGDGFLNLVANMDYSWVWCQKNFYGFVEAYYNGLGERDDYAEALLDPDVFERVDRGELFTLGRAYLSGHIRMELHPLFNVSVTTINNLNDPSGILQPRVIWDVTENSQVTAGFNVAYGGHDTEFDGFEIPSTDFIFNNPDSAFFWWTYYF